MHGNYFRITTALCHLTAVLWIVDCWAGLFGEHVPATELARSAAGVQVDDCQVDRDAARRGQLGSHLGTGHVLT